MKLRADRVLVRKGWECTMRTYELRKNVMKFMKNEDGKVGWILLWALGIPIPVLFILFAIRGCT
jgi:hypothetical protein